MAKLTHEFNVNGVLVKAFRKHSKHCVTIKIGGLYVSFDEVQEEGDDINLMRSHKHLAMLCDVNKTDVNQLKSMLN